MKLTSSWPERKPTIKSNLRVFLVDIFLKNVTFFLLREVVVM